MCFQNAQAIHSAERTPFHLVLSYDTTIYAVVEASLSVPTDMSACPSFTPSEDRSLRRLAMLHIRVEQTLEISQAQ